MATRTLIAGPVAFTGTNGDSIGYAGGYDNTNWQNTDPAAHDGYLVINTNGYISAFAGFNDAYWKGAGTFTDDQYFEVTLQGAQFGNGSQAIGGFLRGQDTDWNTRDGYRVYFQNVAGATYVRVDKVVNGVATQIGTNITQSFAAGDKLSAEVTTVTGQAVIEVFKNTTSLGTRTDTTSILTGGKPGITAAGASSDIRGDDWTGGTVSTASTPGNASGDVATVTASGVSGSASSTRAVTVTLRNNSGLPLNTVSRRFWTRTALDVAASDGGAGGLAVTCDSSGIFILTGLTVLAGAGWLTYKDPADDLNCHTVPVTFA